MARKVRKVSQSGIYHVILRGVNKQRIFEQAEDYETIKRILAFVRTHDTDRQPVEEPNYFLYAYCIMDNHIHMLIQPNGVELGRIMKRIMTTYAIYFNKTYERVGHLFQDRYKSEVVESADYFFTAVQYIHRNPVKAGICSHPSRYLHSSWQELANGIKDEEGEKRYEEGQSPNVSFLCCFPEIGSRLEMEEEYHRHAVAMEEWQKTKVGNPPRLKSMNLLGITPEDVCEMVQTQTEGMEVRGLFGKVKERVQDSDSALCQYLRAHLDWQTAEEKDAAIVNAILEMTGAESISKFQQMDKQTVRTALAIMRDSGIGDTRLSRLTGISRGVIQRARVYPKEK